MTATELQRAGFSLTETVTLLVARLHTGLRQRRAYAELLAELNRLSDRELLDIGIARADIPAIAREELLRRRA